MGACGARPAWVRAGAALRAWHWQSERRRPAELRETSRCFRHASVACYPLAWATMGASIVALALHVLLVCCRANAAARSSDASRLLNVVTRQQRQQPTGRHRWDVVEQSEQWEAARTAFVVVDMWNDHPCLSATFRIHGLAGPMEQVLSAARSAGVSVIHAPSGCGTSMAHLPARQYVLNLTNQPLPSSHPHETPPFPLVVNGSQAECGPPEMKSEMCGCDGTWRVGGSWPKTVYCPQLSTLTVDDRDAVVEDDGGQQIFNVLTDRNITNIVYMGVHESAWHSELCRTSTREA